VSRGDITVGRWPGHDPREYRVTVTRRRDRGQKKVKSFQRNPTTGTWCVDPDHRRLMDRAGDPSDRATDAAAYVLSRRGARLSRSRTAWPLSAGFDLPIGIGSVIFDAVRADNRHEVDIDQLKSVVSQLGSRINALTTMGIEQRRLAEPALYVQVIRALY
jgi:hypothetical protein